MTTTTSEVGTMKAQKLTNLILSEITCPICGKTKPLPYGTDMANYVYKEKINGKSRYMCSYHCFRVAEKREEKRRAEQKAAAKIKREACEDDAKI